MFFIGMMTFTGFSATADLTENSELAFHIDNDVGSMDALMVAQDVNFIEVKTQRVEAPFAKISYANRNYSYLKTYEANLLETIKPPDIRIQSSSIFALNLVPNRNARDAL